MNGAVIILYLALSPAHRAEEQAVFWGDGAATACAAALHDATLPILPQWPEARAYCAEMPSELAPVRSLRPQPRPATISTTPIKEATE